MTEFEVHCLVALGFGFGSIFWSLFFWLLFGDN